VISGQVFARLTIPTKKDLVDYNCIAVGIVDGTVELPDGIKVMYSYDGGCNGTDGTEMTEVNIVSSHLAATLDRLSEYVHIEKVKPYLVTVAGANSEDCEVLADKKMVIESLEIETTEGVKTIKGLTFDILGGCARELIVG